MGNHLDELLLRFPKQRIYLPEEYKNIYVDEYAGNREGQSLAGRFKQYLESWMHHQVQSSPNSFPLLELGAGTLNHINYEPESDSYDIVEPFSDLYKGSDRQAKIRNFYPSIDAIPADTRYRRIISIAVLEHVLDLPRFIAQSALLIEGGGEFKAGIPSEASLLWYLAWRFGTGIPFRIRTGLNYSTLMKYEHVNNAEEILALVSAMFDQVESHRFPLPIFHGSLYTSIIARQPNLDAIEYVLNQ